MAARATGLTEVAPADRWAVLALVIGARVATTVQVQSVGALGPTLLADADLALDYAGLGILIGAYMLPGVFVALPTGWLTSRLGERRIVLAGLVLSTAAGFAFAVAPGFGTAFVARLVAGAGTALLNVVLSAMVMARFTGPALAPAMGGFLAAYPFGIGLVMVTLPALAAASSWRTAMMAVAAGCAVVLAAVPFVMAVQPARPAPTAYAPGAADGATSPSRLLAAREWGPVLASGIAWALFNAGYAVLLGFTPALLTGRGASPETAGALASLAGWACIPLAPLGGAFAEWTGRPLLTITICLSAIAAATLALAAGAGPQSGELLVAGMLTSLVATVIMTLPARALSPEHRATGMGVYYTIFYAGMAALPPVAGWAADGAGGPPVALGVAAAFFASTIVGVVICGWLLTRHRPANCTRRIIGN